MKNGGNRYQILFTLLFILFLIPTVLPGAVIRVPDDQPTIQAGIDAASNGDTVLVADGTYSGPGNIGLDFHGKAITVRSENGPLRCVIDCNAEGFDRDCGFYLHSGEQQDSLICGFTIQEGNRGGIGGGIFCYGASPTIMNNIIIRCRGGYAGGGIGCDDGASPDIMGNTSIDNHAELYGGGIYCPQGATISGNTIRWNTTGYEVEDGSGGGIHCSGSTIILNNIIEENTAQYDDEPYPTYPQGGGIRCSGTVEIIGNLIGRNNAGDGGGIRSFNGTVTIRGNTIIGNDAEEGAGIKISGSESTAVISDNLILNNSGSGIQCTGGSITIKNNLIQGNTYGQFFGGGIVNAATTSAINNTLVENSAAIFIISGTVTVTDSILWDNGGSDGQQIYLHTGHLAISYSDVQGGEAAVDTGYEGTLDWGPGMIDDNPLFVSTPLSDYFLSQTAAGQSMKSPCVNTGSASSESLGLDTRTTRTDYTVDKVIVNMGYHYEVPPPEPDTTITFGPAWPTDAPLLIFTYSGRDDTTPPQDLLFSYRLDGGKWSAFERETQATVTGLNVGLHIFEVRAKDREGYVDPTPASYPVWIEDWWQNSDEWDFMVTGPGPGEKQPALVRTSQNQWLAYSTLDYGVNVACGNLDGNGLDEVITGPGPGPGFGAHVRGWFLDGTPCPGANFMAYGTRQYGVNVSAGDIDGDGYDEIVTGAGPGTVFGPHVRGWNFDGGTAAPIPGANFVAYSTRRWGVKVACGDIDGDGYDEIITGPGPGASFSAHVRGWNFDGTGSTTAIPGANFMAHPSNRWGTNVACGDVDEDGRDEIITGDGPIPTTYEAVRAWNFDNHQIAILFGYAPYSGSYRYGVIVSAGQANEDQRDEILAMPGPDPSALSIARAWRWDGASVNYVWTHVAYDYGMTYGGTIAGGNLK